MIGSASEKIPGGKLLRVSVDYGERINSVRITGDFFMHPEEAIAGIERSLIGAKKEEVPSKLREAASGVTIIGATPEDIARVIQQAMK